MKRGIIPACLLMLAALSAAAGAYAALRSSGPRMGPRRR
jgi:hypothetical protein